MAIFGYFSLHAYTKDMHTSDQKHLLLTHFVVRTLKLCKIQTFNIPARIGL